MFWQSAGGPALLWNGVARNLAEDQAMALDLADSARLLAMEDLSGADAAINCWNDKYHSDFWRPWQAIRQADSDGNPATRAEPDLDAAADGALPRPHVRAPRASTARTFACCRCSSAPTRSRSTSRAASSTVRRGYFDRFSQPLEEIIEARIWAGLHFRTADVQAQRARR